MDPEKIWEHVFLIVFAVWTWMCTFVMYMYIYHNLGFFFPEFSFMHCNNLFITDVEDLETFCGELNSSMESSLGNCTCPTLRQEDLMVIYKQPPHFSTKKKMARQDVSGSFQGFKPHGPVCIGWRSTRHLRVLLMSPSSQAWGRGATQSYWWKTLQVVAKWQWSFAVFRWRL